MPYTGINDPSLPDDVRGLDEAARQVFVSAFNSVFEECQQNNGDDCEESAFAVARDAMGDKTLQLEKSHDLSLSVMDVQGFKLIEQPDGSLRWVGWYTNAYQDRDKEWFAGDAITADVDRMVKQADYPELWFYHLEGAKLGKADAAMFAGRFAVVTGTIYDTEEAKLLAHFAAKQGYRMSHGFWYDAAQFRDNTYHAYQTFEVSVLPADMAANPLTAFVAIEKETTMKAFKISDGQKQALVTALGSEEAADKIINITMQATKDADAVTNANYKQTPDDEAEEDEEEKAEKPDMEKMMEQFDQRLSRMEEKIAELSGSEDDEEEKAIDGIVSTLRDAMLTMAEQVSEIKAGFESFKSGRESVQFKTILEDYFTGGKSSLPEQGQKELWGFEDTLGNIVEGLGLAPKDK